MKLSEAQVSLLTHIYKDLASGHRSFSLGYHTQSTLKSLFRRELVYEKLERNGQYNYTSNRLSLKGLLVCKELGIREKVADDVLVARRVHDTYIAYGTYVSNAPTLKAIKEREFSGQDAWLSVEVRVPGSKSTHDWHIHPHVVLKSELSNFTVEHDNVRMWSSTIEDFDVHEYHISSIRIVQGLLQGVLSFEEWKATRK